jgi:DNA-binding NtrC family response regulator
LEARIAAGTFRQDLYFRLARATVRLPPLRERREDLPLLAAHFIAHFSAEMGFSPPPAISTAALAALAAHDFPGNVRELRNLVENALVAGGGREITPAHLRLAPAGSSSRSPLSRPARPAANEDGDLPPNLDAAEEVLIRRALAQAGGNIAAAARRLGVHRTRIYRVLGAVAAR